MKFANEYKNRKREFILVCFQWAKAAFGGSRIVGYIRIEVPETIFQKDIVDIRKLGQQLKIC